MEFCDLCAEQWGGKASWDFAQTELRKRLHVEYRSFLSRAMALPVSTVSNKPI
jgi:hypothetical protein